MKHFVTCKICNQRLKFINASHLQSHGITLAQYQEIYPNADTMITEVAEHRSEVTSKSWRDGTITGRSDDSPA